MTHTVTAQKHASSHTLRQWHPAFFAIIQIELLQDAKHLTFENEHLLSKKPLQIDVIIIKKEHNYPIVKNIGKLFRRHNIFEYKGPGDYISIDDFYKVYGYACIYKADTNVINEIKITEISLSFVCRGYPRKLMKHLKKLRKFEIRKKYKGIYYVIGDILPIQFIIQNQLSREDNLWLKGLTDNLENDGSIELMMNDYTHNRSSILYKSALEMILSANLAHNSKEDVIMNDFLMEYMKDELDKKMEDGKEIGKEIGREDGKNLINTLTIKLSALGRIDDIIASAHDKEYQQQLLEEFNLA